MKIAKVGQESKNPAKLRNLYLISSLLLAIIGIMTVSSTANAKDTAGPFEQMFGAAGLLLGPALFAIAIAVISAPFIGLAKLIRIIRSKATETPLMKAAAAGDVTEVKKLLSSGVPQDKADAYGRTALSWAIINKQEEAAKTLIDAGADVSTWKNSFALALESKNEDILLWLMEKADAKMLTENHLLKEAAQKNLSTDILRKIIEKDTDGAYKTPMNNNRSDMDEALTWTILHNVASEFVDFLLENGAGLADHPLWYAAQGGSLPLVKKFIELGDDLEAKYGGKTCLAVAAINGHYEIAKLLLENKANPKVTVAVTTNGITQHWSLISRVRSRKNMVSLLEEYSAR